MGPKILIPLFLLIVIVPTVSFWAKKRFKTGLDGGDSPVVAPSGRLTSNALRSLSTPPWRVVYEIGPDKLGGIEHVLIGPAGAFALTTSLEPLPPPHAPDADHDDPHEVARVAIIRGELDDALRRCALQSSGLVEVHWGPAADGAPASLSAGYGVIAVEGRQLEAWADGLASNDGTVLTPAQVDLAWQTVVTAIGRPDPLA